MRIPSVRFNAICLHFTVCIAAFGVPIAPAQELAWLAEGDPPLAVTRGTRATCIEYADLVVRLRFPQREAGEGIYVGRPGRDGCRNGLRGAQLLPEKSALFFKGKLGRYLILDQGTGPSMRRLVLFDWQASRLVHDDFYSGPTTVTVGRVAFWRPSQVEAGPQNCPSFSTIVQHGHAAVIEREAAVELSSGAVSRVDLAGVRCVAVQ